MLMVCRDRSRMRGTWARAATASRSTRSIRAQYSHRMVLQQAHLLMVLMTCVHAMR